MFYHIDIVNPITKKKEKEMYLNDRFILFIEKLDEHDENTKQFIVIGGHNIIGRIKNIYKINDGENYLKCSRLEKSIFNGTYNYLKDIEINLDNVISINEKSKDDNDVQVGIYNIVTPVDKIVINGDFDNIETFKDRSKSTITF